MASLSKPCGSSGRRGAVALVGGMGGTGINLGWVAGGRHHTSGRDNASSSG